MNERTLRGCRVMVVEDEYMLADMMSETLADAGATILGPVGTITGAVDLLDSGTEIHGAILDVNVRGDMVYPVADLLLARGIPFVFTTGYDATVIPPRYEQVPRCEKPFKLEWVTRAIGRVMHG